MTLVKFTIPEVSGVYIIRNTISDHIYIGSAANLRNRKYQHWDSLNKGRHHNSHLQNAWLKYGQEAFWFEVVEFAEDYIAAEQRWLDKFDAAHSPGCYNVLPLAHTTAGRVVSQATKDKMSKALTGRKILPEWREKMRAAKLGKHLSSEHRAKLSAAGKGKRSKKRKLDDADVRYIRHSRKTNSVLSVELGISGKTISKIRLNQRYKDVLDD